MLGMEVDRRVASFDEQIQQFLHERSGQLQRVAWALTGDWALSEDLTQVAITKTWKRWNRISKGAHYAYARRALITSYLDWRRKLSSTEVPIADLTDLTEADDARHDSDLHLDVLVSIRALPPRQRVAVVLRYLEDLSEVDTARTMRCSVGSVKTHTARALKQLRSSSIASSVE